MLLLALAGSVFAQTPAQVNVATLKQGDVIPDVRGATLDGKPFHLSGDLKGKVVLLDFWATWCGPCVAETPNILKNHQRWHDKGFEVVAISLDNKPDAAEAYAKAKKLPWAQICDGMAFRSPLARAFSITAIPQFILLDREGRVAAAGVRGEKLGEELERLLGFNPAAAQARPVSDLSELDRLITQGPDATATQAVEALLSRENLPLAEIDSLVVRHAESLSVPASPWALYLLVDSVLSRSSVPVDLHSSASCLAARCALELGGPYLATQMSEQAVMKPGNPSVAHQAMIVHQARKTGDAELAIRCLHAMIGDGKALYDDVKMAIGFLGDADPGKSSSLHGEIRLWLKAQENLPPSRMKVDKTAGKLVVSLDPAGTHMAGCLSPKLMVAPQGASFFVVPMKLDGDRFTAEIDPPPAGRAVRWYVTDGRSRSDTNEGRYWSVESPQ